MGAGLFVAFYMVHMRLWIAAVPDASGKLVLWVGGQANKNRDRFEQKFGEWSTTFAPSWKMRQSRLARARKEEPELTLAGVK